MKKSLIAIAALAAVGAASAQSSVTLYGLADISTGQAKATTTDAAGNKTVVKNTGFASGVLQGSRLGVKGSEDLGNGLKAVFNYEMGFNAINGGLEHRGASGLGATTVDAIGTNPALKSLNTDTSSVGFTRRAVVGLEGDFGSVLLGTDYTPLFNLAAATSADGLSTYEPASAGMFTNRASGVHYAGNFSGVGVNAFYGRIQQSVDNTSVNYTNVLANGYGVGLSYANGPLVVGGAWQQFKPSYSDSLGSWINKKSTEWGLGVAYDFSVAKLYANYLENKGSISKGGAAAYSLMSAVGGNVQNGAYATGKNQEFNIGVTVPFGAASVMAEYGRNKGRFMDDAGNTQATYKGNDWMIGANYAFSKRTDVYARVARYDAKKSYNAADVATGSSKNDVYAVGLRHKF